MTRLNISKNIIIGSILISFFLLWSCYETRESRTGSNYNIADPYQASFFGSNAKYLIPQDEFGNVDTIFFDAAGNIVRVKGLGKDFMKMGFNNSHLITQHWTADDIHEHFMLTYDSTDSVLIQNWTRIRSPKWKYNLEDVDTTEMYQVIFVFDDDKLLMEVNFKENQTCRYFYSEERLTKKACYDLCSKRALMTTLYFYEEDVISRIEQFNEGLNNEMPDVVHYFNRGRLDSTARNYKTTLRVIHKTTTYMYGYFSTGGE